MNNIILGIVIFVIGFLFILAGFIYRKIKIKRNSDTIFTLMYYCLYIMIGIVIMTLAIPLFIQ
jgi:O-antigen ligase